MMCRLLRAAAVLRAVCSLASGITLQAFENFHRSRLSEAEKLYAEEFAVDREFGLKQMFGDNRYVLAARTMARSAVTKSAQARLYYVDFIPDSRSKEWSGTPHGADGYFLWSGETSGDEQVADLSKRLQSLLGKLCAYRRPKWQRADGLA